ncbi:MAG: hypothetical protein ACYDC5_10630 [Candidatus Dormibacteria bacterium]
MAFDTTRSHSHEHAHWQDGSGPGEVLLLHSHQHDHLAEGWAKHEAPKDWAEGEGPMHSHSHKAADPSGTLAVRGRDGKLRPGPVGKVAVADLTKAHRADPVMAHYYEVKANTVTDKALEAGYRQLAKENR